MLFFVVAVFLHLGIKTPGFMYHFLLPNNQYYFFTYTFREICIRKSVIKFKPVLRGNCYPDGGYMYAGTWLEDSYDIHHI
jgi:hypothetical protein